MKNKLILCLMFALVGGFTIYLYSCQKELAPEAKMEQQDAKNENLAVDRAGPFCSLSAYWVSGSTNIRLCGFGINGTCYDCGSNVVGGVASLGTYNVTSFPKKFGLRNYGTTAGTVTFSWSCGPYYCGGSYTNVVIPAGQTRIFTLSNNGSSCSCSELLCE